MTDFERFKLCQWLNRRLPRIVFEVGTGVGGSTFYICKSLQAHGGKLYTCDPARRPPDRFLNEFAGVLDYRQLESTVMIGQLIGQGIRPDFIFFDGPEIPELALQDLNLLEQVIAPGTQFAMHDWHLGRRGYDGGQSIKAALVRPYLYRRPLGSEPLWPRKSSTSVVTRRNGKGATATVVGSPKVGGANEG
jgi:hypothetical protein